MTTAIETCKHNARRSMSGLCEGCRATADARKYLGMRFTVERNGARVTVDPKFDVPNRSVAATARAALTEGSEVHETVYPWMPVRRDGEGYSPLECDADAEHVASRILMDARGTAERAAYGQEAREERLRRVKGMSRGFVRRVLSDVARAFRFGGKCLGYTSAPKARYARMVAQALANAVVGMAERIRRALTRCVDAARRTVIERGWVRATDTLTRMVARLEGRAAPTLSGRGSSMAMCRAARAYEGGACLNGYSTLAEAREALARGEAGDGVVEALEALDDGAPLTAVSACLSVRKARGSKARAKRAADALARAEKARIEREREGRRAMLVPLAMYDLPLLNAELADARGRVAEISAKAKGQRKSARNTNGARNASAYVSAILAEIAAREDDAKRKEMRAIGAERAENRAFADGWMSGHPLTQDGKADTLSRSSATPKDSRRIKRVGFPAPSGMLTCDTADDGYASFNRKALEYGYTVFAFAAPKQETPTSGWKTVFDAEGSVQTCFGPPTKGARKRFSGVVNLATLQNRRTIRTLIWTAELKTRIANSAKRDLPRETIVSGVRLIALTLRLARLRVKGEQIMLAALGAALA